MDEEIVGCTSEFHGMVHCRDCVHPFGEEGCWAYRNEYHPKLIEEIYIGKFGDVDSRVDVELIDRAAAFEGFMKAMMEKEEVRRRERKDEEGKDRPVLPWKVYTGKYLFKWFEKEVEELHEAFFDSRDPKRVMDECLDVANFACFLYHRCGIDLHNEPD